MCGEWNRVITVLHPRCAGTPRGHGRLVAPLRTERAGRSHQRRPRSRCDPSRLTESSRVLDGQAPRESSPAATVRVAFKRLAWLASRRRVFESSGICEPRFLTGRSLRLRKSLPRFGSDRPEIVGIFRLIGQYVEGSSPPPEQQSLPFNQTSTIRLPCFFPGLSEQRNAFNTVMDNA
jgi:hypothetical protein